MFKKDTVKYKTRIKLVLLCGLIYIHKTFFLFCFFCLSDLSHGYIPLDTVNSFYPVWNTHGATNKHILIYGHVHTQRERNTHMHTCTTGTHTCASTASAPTLRRRDHKTSNTSCKTVDSTFL